MKLIILLAFPVLLCYSCSYTLGPASMASEAAATPIPTLTEETGSQLFVNAAAGSGVTFHEADENSFYRLGFDFYYRLRFPRIGRLIGLNQLGNSTISYVGFGADGFNGSYRIDPRNLPTLAGTHWYRGFSVRASRGFIVNFDEQLSLHTVAHVGALREYGDFSEAILRTESGIFVSPPAASAPTREVGMFYMGGSLGFGFRPTPRTRVNVSALSYYSISQYLSAQTFGFRIDLSTPRLGFNLRALYFFDELAPSDIVSPVVISGGVHYELFGQRNDTDWID